jgi:hypothetical protein
MSAKRFLRSRRKYRDTLLIGCISCLLLIACGGGSSGGGGGGDEDPPPTTEAQWYKSVIATVASNSISVHLVAQPEGDDTIHLAYYDNSGDETYYGGIQYAKAQIRGNDVTVVDAFTNVNKVDNSATLDLALDDQGQPVVVYRGGNILFCQPEQADVIVSEPGSTAWDAYTAAIGYVQRNPAEQLQDGKSGTESAIAIDSSGNAHIVFTFRYEGCETVNHIYPDLRYVEVDSRNPVSEREDEETVHGNIYPEFNVVEENNSVGFYCDLVLDAQDQPLAFYAENKEVIGTSNGLHMAYKAGDPAEWIYEWVEELDDDETVMAISAAVSPIDGAIAVAYAVETEEDGHSYKMLKYAYRDTDGNWHPVVVDESASVGIYCSLAFSAEGEPLIAYHAIESHSGYDLGDLKLAWKTASGWERETVAQAGIVGKYNTLWIDADDAPNIVTYNDTTNEILYYVKR